MWVDLNRLLVAAALCAAVLVWAAGAAADDVIKDQARCYSTWDDAYLYLAFKIDCPDVRAVNSAPNAPVDGDDAVEFFIQTTAAHTDAVNPDCSAMAVSAAGGAIFRAGTQDGELKPTPVFTFKYGATVQGTLNNSDDTDMGYVVEIAVPWAVLRTRPPSVGDMMRFNVLIRRHGEDPDSFVSLSPEVRSQSDALVPSKWASIVFAAHGFGVATTSLDKIVSPRYVVRPPLVDGTIGEREWHRNTMFAIDLPMPEGFVYEAKFPVHRLVLTHYFYWYQADPHKAAPESHIVFEDGRAQLQTHPVRNAGPWFSYDRVGWHKDELSDVVAAGIDVVLPIYWGDATNRAGFAAKGLDCMVSALQELKAEGKPYPLVGMFFDTTAMMLAYDHQKPDLRNEEVQRAFYGMIKDFFERIPYEYRAVAQADKPNSGVPGNIVVLYTGAFFSDFDSGFVEYCNRRYEQDFGCPLIWIASSDFKAKAEGFDGFCNYGAGLGRGYDDSGRIQIGSVGAGFDDSAVALGRQSRIRSRMGGETYRSDWAGTLKSNPHWVVCDGWNEFHEGSDLCASREYGRNYIDATRANVSRFLGGRDFDAQYMRYNVPAVVPPRQFAQAELTIRNIGASPWRASDGYALGYRWYRSGRYYGESKVRRPLDKDVMPGDIVTVTVGIATVNADGQELPDGPCEIRFELMRLSDGKWFSALGDQPLMLPITIGRPDEWAATYLSCSAPVMMAAGQVYPAIVRVRNDGTQVWKKGAVKLGCRLYRVANYTHDRTVDLSEEVPTADMRALLTSDCKPGEIAEFAIAVALADPKKKPVPAWKQDLPWSYQLRFDLYNGGRWLSELGVRTHNQTVGVFENDHGPRIVDCDIPRKLRAGQTVETRVVIRNNGALSWNRRRVKLGYHWYHLDGVEMRRGAGTSPIPANIDPGTPAVLTASVTAPEYDGRYVLVWDLMIDDKWVSAEPLSRGGDILPVFVEVTGGRLVFADLAGLFDVSATSPDTDRTAGDFDGRGGSFPAEFVPPDADPDGDASYIFPAGYKWDRRAQPDGRISFLYPGKIPGVKNAVTCDGRKVDVEDARYVAVHILGASANGAASGEVSVNYSDGAEKAMLEIPDWGTAPRSPDSLGYGVRHRHSHGGDELDTPCYLHRVTIPIDGSRVLTSITLPNVPDARVVAITLERGSVPGGQ